MVKSIKRCLFLFIVLIPAAAWGDTGSVYVTSKPSGATIFLDNNPLGKKTDALIEDIPIGPHKIRIEHPEYGKVEETFEIKTGLTTALQFELQARELKDAAAYHSRGFSRFSQDQLDLAISDFTKAIELDPKFLVAFYNRGIAYFDQGKYDSASFDLTKAIDLGLKGKGAYTLRGLAYGRHGQYDQAIDDFSKVIDLDSKDPSIYYVRGIVFFLKGEPRQAMTDLQKAMDLDPPHAPRYHFCLGIIYDRMGDSDTARTHFFRARELDKDIVKKQSESMEKRVLYASRAFFADGILSASKYLAVMPPVVARAEEILKINPMRSSSPTPPSSGGQRFLKFFSWQVILVLVLAAAGLALLLVFITRVTKKRKGPILK